MVLPRARSYAPFINPMSPAKRDNPQYRERVYKIVRRIPAGRVMTYGQIAEILGEGYTPRTVGFVMHGSDESNTPWHRVINSQGRCTTGRLVLPSDKQQRMLEAEGVEFNDRARCNLQRYLWIPGSRGIGTKPSAKENPAKRKTP